MAEAKHAFVDDNPYLVYSPKAETTSEGGSGGGASLQIVQTNENGILSVTAAEMVEMLENAPIFTRAIISVDSNTIDTWIMFGRYQTSGSGSETAYAFIGIAVLKPELGGSAIYFIAESQDGYPQYTEEA